nr:NAD(P)H-dependent oxidoreductase [uncultured Moellerella sp.]
MYTILLSHPWHGSFCKFILDTITTKLTENKQDFQIIDLHKDNFNPVLSESELALYSKGQFIDPLVGKYQQMLKNSAKVIFIYPIWWMGMPAMLKGFFDKVMLADFAWYYDEKALKLLPLLAIEKTLVITTSEEDTALIIEEGNAINDGIHHCMSAVGFNNAQWINCDHITMGSDEHRMSFLTEVLASL